MNPIETGTLAYANRELRVPARGAALEGHTASSRQTVDRGSKLYEQCSEFESIFVKMMLKEMRDTVQKSGLNDGGPGEEIFSDMLYDEYAKSMAKTANFGLADQIYLQLVRTGGAAS